MKPSNNGAERRLIRQPSHPWRLTNNTLYDRLNSPYNIANKLLNMNHKLAVRILFIISLFILEIPL